MLPASLDPEAPAPPPACPRARVGRHPALHLDALTLVRRLHVLALCRLAVEYAHWRCPPPLRRGVAAAHCALARAVASLLPRCVRLVGRLACPRPGVWAPAPGRWWALGPESLTAVETGGARGSTRGRGALGGRGAPRRAVARGRRA